MRPSLPLLLSAFLLAGSAQATPERAAQQRAAQQQQAMPASGQDQFPPAMMQAMAERDAAEAQQVEAAAVEPAPSFAPVAAAPATEDPLPQLSEAPAGPPVTDQALIHQRSQSISEGLRCPVCQGLSAADSQAESAVAMRVRAADLVAAGYSDAQINAYFVERYGEWVLLEPPRTGKHWLIWLGPLLLLALGALVVAWRMTAEAKDGEGQELVRKDAEDPYERRILDELERS
jgi:cytochrome c-type biogenesis protein CcmH